MLTLKKIMIPVLDRIVSDRDSKKDVTYRVDEEKTQLYSLNRDHNLTFQYKVSRPAI